MAKHDTSPNPKPVVYLLCGLGGSGKSIYAQKLADEGIQKFSLDEYVYERHGRAITQLPEAEYVAYYRTAQAELDDELVGALERGRSVVLDYGFWRRDSRDRYKRLVEDKGGQWKLIYLKAAPDVLLKRLAERNKRTDANAFPVTEEKLSEYIERFQEPQGEGELVVVQT